jgi:EmrB/QacA subfamily drug resistance transporter
MAFLDGTVVNVALAHIGRDLHATVAGLQWTVTSYTLALAALVLLGGALGDRYGRRRIFIVGVLWFTASSVLCGLSTDVGMLMTVRALQGVGAALLIPGSLALLQSSFAERDRGRAIGAWSGLTGVSAAIGPFLGGWLVDSFSWRWIFFINVPLAVLTLIATLIWVPESRSAGTGRFDVAGAVLGAIGLAGITYALIQRGSVLGTVLAVLVGIAALIAFVLLERRRGERAMLPPRLFVNRQFSAINAVTFFVYAGLGALFFFLIIELQVAAGFSALVAGLALLPMTILMILGSARAGALAARIGPRWPLTVGPLLATGGLLLMLRIGEHTSYLGDVLPAALLFGLGMTVLVAPLTAAVLAAASVNLAGVASGVNNAVARAAGLFSVAALPLLVGLSGDAYEQPAALNAAFHQALWWCIGLYLAGAVVAVTMVSQRRCKAAPPTSPEVPQSPAICPVPREPAEQH